MVMRRGVIVQHPSSGQVATRTCASSSLPTHVQSIPLDSRKTVVVVGMSVPSGKTVVDTVVLASVGGTVVNAGVLASSGTVVDI